MILPSRILVIRWGRLGDLILTAAATRELAAAFPDARIDLAVKAEYREVGELLPGVTKILPLAGSGISDLIRYRRRILGKNYDLLIDLQGNGRSRFLALLVGGRRIGYSRISLRRRLLVLRKWGRGRDWKPVWRRYLAAVERAGPTVSVAPPRLLLPVGEGGVEGAIAVAPGAGRATKRWPAERFAELIRVAAERFGRPILLVGSKEEEDLLRGIAGSREFDGTIRAGGSLKETAAHLAAASLLVTNDSGLMHLACGIGTPVIAIFGPTTTELGFGPTGGRDTVLSRDLTCRPCSLHGTLRCPLPDRSHRCMTEVGTEQVIGAMERILGDSEKRDDLE